MFWFYASLYFYFITFIRYLQLLVAFQMKILKTYNEHVECNTLLYGKLNHQTI